MSILSAPGRLPLRLLLLGLALVAGAGVYFLSTPVFYAKSAVRVNAAGGIVRARNLAKDLTQPQLIERTAARLGVKATASELKKTHVFDLTAQAISADAIEVEVWAASKDWANRWGEELVAESIDFRRIRLRKETLDAVRGLNREMSEIAAKLGGAGARKFEATDKAGLAQQLAEIDELRNPAREIAPLKERINQLTPLHTELQKVEIPLLKRLETLTAFERATNPGNTPEPAPWQEIEERRRPLVELRQMLEFTDLAPDAMLMAIDDLIAEFDRKLQTEFSVAFRRFDVDYRNMVDQLAAMEAKAAQPSGPAENALNMRLRHLAQRIDALGVADPADGEPVYAGLKASPDRPVSPDLWKIILWSALGGVALAVGVPPLLSRSPRGGPMSAQLQTRLGLRTLATVPSLEGLPPRVPALAVSDNEVLAPLRQSFAELRDSLLADGEVPRVILVTSALPGEGKTITAANLGIAFAEAGRRTVVIDTDLRRGRLHRLFGFRPTPGLANVLSGDLSVATAVRATPMASVFVLNSGGLSATAADLLAPEHLQRILTELRESFDIIILDSPPVLGLPAAGILGPLADATLLVVSEAKTSAPAVGAALETLRAVSAKVRGVVLNRPTR